MDIKRTISILCSILFYAGILFAGNIIDKDKSTLDKDGTTTWYSGEVLPIEGKGFSDTESFYDRLPARAKESVPAPVWSLSHKSAGMALHFVSDGGSFKIRWEVISKSLNMPHMPATGVSGVDVYRKTPEGWRFVKNGRPTSVTNEVAVSISPNTECLVYL
jgi:hypothetical protein